MKDFKDMRYYADIAETMNIAQIKQDEPGWIRRFVSNMKDKVKLLGTGDLSKSEEYQSAKTQEEKDFIIASEKHRRRNKDREKRTYS